MIVDSVSFFFPLQFFCQQLCCLACQKSLGILNGTSIQHHFNIKTFLGTFLSCMMAVAYRLLCEPEGPMIRWGWEIAILNVKATRLRVWLCNICLSSSTGLKNTLHQELFSSVLFPIPFSLAQLFVPCREGKGLFAVCFKCWLGSLVRFPEWCSASSYLDNCCQFCFCKATCHTAMACWLLCISCFHLCKVCIKIKLVSSGFTQQGQ